ncbi:MAG: superinfection exclusion B family protein [Desulfobacterales bacterium]|jgi:hypothetical protein|nr:superinfection exclusion B family protein [Desulfobacterales bacterium]
MKRLIIFYILLLILYGPLCSSSLADIVVLKNGQVISDVTITDLGDTIVCESQSRTYYINKESVESIARTDSKDAVSHFRGWADDLLSYMPPTAKKYINTYPRLIIAGISLIGIIILMIAAVRRLPVSRILTMGKAIKKKRQSLQYVKQLDENEKSVLREFIIQGQNTIEMPVEDKTIAGLIHKGILEQIGSKGEYSVRGLMLPVMISFACKKRLNPQILGMPPVLNDETRNTLIASRPKFISELSGFYKKLEKKSDIYW